MTRGDERTRPDTGPTWSFEAAIETVAPDLLLKRRARNTEKAGRLALVSSGVPEHGGNMAPLDFLERGGNERVRLAGMILPGPLGWNERREVVRAAVEEHPLPFRVLARPGEIRDGGNPMRHLNTNPPEDRANALDISPDRGHNGHAMRRHGGKLDTDRAVRQSLRR